MLSWQGLCKDKRSTSLKKKKAKEQLGLLDSDLKTIDF